MASSSTSEVVAENTHPRDIIISKYFTTCKNSNQHPSLQHFFENNLEEIANHTDLHNDLKAIWSKSYKSVAKATGIPVSADTNIDWSALKEKICTMKTDSSKTCTTRSSTTSKSRSGTLLTEAAFADVVKKFDEVIKSGKVWRLSSGTVVEEVMKDIAMSKPYEHPVHSMIIDPEDPIYTNKFTEDDLQEIRDYKGIYFDLPLPEELHEYLYSYRGLKNLEDLNEKVLGQVFPPNKKPDLFWAWETFLQTINLYNFDSLNDDFIEDDLEYRVWYFIAKCFVSTKIRASSGKEKSRASTERHNQNRTLAGSEEVTHQISGCQPDLKCVYLGHEIAFSEVGLFDDGETVTKKLYERGLKAPKMLKDFFASLTRTFPSAVRDTKTAAFIISGFHITAAIMDSPSGSVCRVTYSERAEFPRDPSLCVKQLVPIMELVYRVRQYLQQTVDSIEDDEEIVSIGRKNKRKAHIPPAIITPQIRTSTSSNSTTTNNSDHDNRETNNSNQSNKKARLN